MPDSLFLLLYHQILGETLVPLGFKQSVSDFWRERDRLLHVISLERPRVSDFTGHFGVIPLACAYENIAFGFGARLHELTPNHHAHWPTPDPKDEDQLRRVIWGYAQTLIHIGVPWLDRFSRPIDLVRVDQVGDWGTRRPTVGFAQPHLKWHELGICALADGDCASARSYLEKARDGFTRHTYPLDSGWDWVRTKIAATEFYLTHMRAHDCQSVQAKIAESETTTYQTLSFWLASRTRET